VSDVRGNLADASVVTNERAEVLLLPLLLLFVHRSDMTCSGLVEGQVAGGRGHEWHSIAWTPLAAGAAAAAAALSAAS
jgi:hypothetical protein